MQGINTDTGAVLPETRSIFQCLRKDPTVKGLVISRSDGAVVYSTMDPDQSRLASLAAYNSINSIQASLRALDDVSVNVIQINSNASRTLIRVT